MASNALVILQARLASRRLPRKAVAPICGRPLIGHCLMRLSGRLPLVLATTTLPEDDRLVSEAAACGAAVVRGPVDDVLARFVIAACEHGARYVIRATADNPAVDMDAPARVLEALLQHDADYVSERGLPIGAAVEGVRVDALLRAARETQSPYDREHVTPYIRTRADQFAVVHVDAPTPLRRPTLRLTVDTPADLQSMRHLLWRAGEAPAPLAAIIAAAEQPWAAREVA